MLKGTFYARLTFRSASPICKCQFQKLIRCFIKLPEQKKIYHKMLRLNFLCSINDSNNPAVILGISHQPQLAVQGSAIFSSLHHLSTAAWSRTPMVIQSRPRIPLAEEVGGAHRSPLSIRGTGSQTGHWELGCDTCA